MPFKAETISKGDQHQPINRGLGQAMRQVKQMVPGQSVIASTDGSADPVETIMPVEVLTEEQIKQKAAIVSLLLKAVDPPMLSRRHPNPIADKISFMEKVKGMSLVELMRFVPAGMNVMELDLREKITEDVRLEMTKKYKDLSP